jgi:hypothetical protein
MDGGTSKLTFHAGQFVFEVEGDDDLVREGLTFIKEYVPADILGLAGKKPVEDGPIREEADGQATPPTQPDHPPEALRDFYQRKNPKNDMEKVTIAAFYAKEYRGKDEITEEDVRRLLNEAGERKLPRNVANTLNNAARANYGYLERVKGKRGSYEVTNAGQNLVNYDLEERNKSNSK